MFCLSSYKQHSLRKYKTKISKYGKGELKFNDEFMEEDVDNHETVTVTKSKRFAIKPMDVEEACVQMELLGHSFFVYACFTAASINSREYFPEPKINNQKEKRTKQ